MIFQIYLSAVYSKRRPPSLFGDHCEIFQTAHMANFEENVEEMVGTTREAADGDKSPAGTRPGTRPAVPAVPGTRPATRRWRWLVMNETAATGGVMYADEGPYTIDVRHLCLASIAKFCDGGL